MTDLKAVVNMAPDDLDRIAQEFRDLAGYVAKLTEELETMKTILRGLGPGDHPTPSGLVIKVRPARKFNVLRGLSMLDPEDRERCMIRLPDASLVKERLTIGQVNDCMEPGTSRPTIKVE
jgi:hypothetical protein